MSAHRSHYLAAAAIALVLLLALTGTQTDDRATWLLEVLPVIVALPVLWASHDRFPLTSLLYVFIFLHALVLVAGGTYTYAKVPFGFYLEDILDLSRNPYDRIGHFFQGFVPALIAREILIRGRYVQGSKMLIFISICIVMAISATYELIEWAVALILGQGADEFLGTQGDPWDTQSDMFFALIGASCALLLLSRLHDRQIHVIQSDEHAN